MAGGRSYRGLRVLRILAIYLLATVLLMMTVVVTACGEDQPSGEDQTSGETTADTTDATAVPPRRDDVIIFIRDNEIWAINPNNGTSFQVTDDGRSKAAPRLSPDGKSILYFLGDDDASVSAGICLVSLAEKAPAKQIRSGGAWPAWSTDGKHIAFTRKRPEPGHNQTDDIAIISADGPGGGEDVITDHNQIVDMGGALAVGRLEYSPDGGRYIYFMRGRRSDSRWLARVEVATGKEDDVSAPPGPKAGFLADGGFSLFNVSQLEGRRALIARGDTVFGDYQIDHQLFIRFLEPRLEDSMIEASPGSINPSLKPDDTRFVYENNSVLYIHKLAGGGDIVRLTGGTQPDWGASSQGPGAGATDTTGSTTTT